MRYLIVGWNKIAESLARNLKYRGFDFKIFSRNVEKIDQNILEEFEIDHLKNLFDHINRNCIVIILKSNIIEKIKTIKEIRNYSKKCKLVTISSKDELEELEKYQLDGIVIKDDLISSSLVKKIDNLKDKSKSKEIVEIVKNSKKEIAIFLHNNPDPDSFASAMAFEKICEDYDKKFNTYYSGNIGHPENEIMINSTEIKMTKIEKDGIKDVLNDSDVLVFLDFAKPGHNNLLPDNINPDIIIDHHRTNKDVKQTGFIEIRTDVGATSTLMTKHLLNLGIGISPILASSLLYGIKVDTDNFTKNIFVQDFKIISFLSAIADKDLLDIFESPPVDPDTVSALGKAIVNRKFKQESLVAYAGKISEKDDIPQIANILSRERDISNVLIYGLLDNKIYMSARSKELKLDIGKKMKKAFSSIGSAGGHQHSAGGVIDISIFDDIEEAKSRIEEIFIEEVV